MEAKIGFGILGAGFIGAVHAAAIARDPRARLAAVCSATADKARALAELYPDAVACETYEELCARPDVQVVCICTPSGMHSEQIVAAARAGKHLVCEKPLDVTLSRIDAALDAVDQCGVKLAAIFQRRFQPNSSRVKAALEHGKLGRLHTADVLIKWFRTQEYYDSGRWRGTMALDGGGCLMNQGIHAIDLMHWFAGPVRAVTALTATVAHERIEVEDQALALVEYANGARGVLEGSTSCYPGLPTIHELHGTLGSIGLREDKLSLWRFVGDTPEDEASLLREANGERAEVATGDPRATLGEPGESHFPQIQDMVSAILEDRSPICTGRDARHAVEIILSLYESAQTARRVELR